MLKKIVLAALLFVPLSMFAQDKIAYVNSMEVFNAMPETAAAESEFAKFSQSIAAELKRQEDEYNKKMADFQQQSDSLAQSIKVRRMQELQDIRNRTATYYEESQQELEKKRNDLNTPIVQKIQDAIKAVGTENGYTYVMERNAFLYVAPNATDATSLVKAKLGIK